MSNVSIFETRWINLVFEGRNKEYGAYQLRQENPKTTIKALFIGLLLITSLASIPLLSGLASNTKTVADIIPADPTIVIVEYKHPPKQPIEDIAAPLTKSDKPKTEIKKDDLSNATVAQKEDSNSDVATNEELENNNTNDPSEGGITADTNGGKIGGTGTDTETNNIVAIDTSTGPYVESTLDIKPSFPGGIDSFYKYVAKNFKTPEMDNDRAIKVLVSFVIEKDGSMTDIKVHRNPGYGLDKEAIRVLKSLKTKWSPGMIKGKPVRTSYNLPINVVLK